MADKLGVRPRQRFRQRAREDDFRQTRQGVRTRFFGRRERIPAELREKMSRLEAATADRDRLSLWIAFDYGGRAELVEAARRLVADGVPASEVTEEAIAARLYAPELPDPDLLVRTSGEERKDMARSGRA